MTSNLRLAEVVAMISRAYSQVSIGEYQKANDCLSHLLQIVLTAERSAPETSQRKPDGYAYRYPDTTGGTYIAFQPRHDRDALEVIPYFYGSAPKAAEPLAHKWDADGERCTVCGDKDWMGTTCSGPPSKTDQCLCTPLAQQHLASFGTIAVTIHPDCPLHASSRKSSQYECPSCGHGIHSTAHKQACKIQHGVNCPEVHHEPSTSGYLHESGDSRPYDVDGVKYCGRCHEYLS